MAGAVFLLGFSQVVVECKLVLHFACVVFLSFVQKLSVIDPDVVAFVRVVVVNPIEIVFVDLLLM